VDPRTTICCTVGPACREVDVLSGMATAGADVFRVSGAHADEAAIAGWVDRVREAETRVGRPLGVLLDLPGTKFRLGEVGGTGRRPLERGEVLRLDGAEGPGDATRLPVRSFPFFEDLRPGTPVVLGDGHERLRVLASDPTGITVEVVEGGEVRSGTGVHFPGVALPTAVPTRRDRELLASGVAAGVDAVAQSFVRTAEDVSRLREALAALGARSVLAVAKVERLEAIRALDRIAERADALIVARGDLGIDAGVDQVPSLQRRVLEAGRRAARPVVIATEILESMVRNVRPTRAEVSDAAGAVFDAADGVMLTAETAVGAYPVLAVETLARILTAAEADPSAPYAGTPFLAAPERRAGRPDEHVVRAAVDLARETGAASIVVFTRHGSSAVRLAKERPAARIHAFAPSLEVGRRLTLAWGVRTVPLPAARDTDEILALAARHLLERGGHRAGDRVVAVMGSRGDPAGATTLIKLMTL